MDESAQEVNEHAAWTATELPCLQNGISELTGQRKACMIRKPCADDEDCFNTPAEHVGRELYAGFRPSIRPWWELAQMARFTASGRRQAIWFCHEVGRPPKTGRCWRLRVGRACEGRGSRARRGRLRDYADMQIEGEHGGHDGEGGGDDHEDANREIGVPGGGASKRKPLAGRRAKRGRRKG